jgi:hypothetical protein
MMTARSSTDVLADSERQGDRHAKRLAGAAVRRVDRLAEGGSIENQQLQLGLLATPLDLSVHLQAEIAARDRVQLSICRVGNADAGRLDELALELLHPEKALQQLGVLFASAGSQHHRGFEALSWAWKTRR